MSIELKQAAQDAAEAIDWLLKTIRRDAPQLSGKAMGNAEKCASALRAALSQQPATPEPVAWVVMNGVSKYQVCGAKAPADALCSEMQKRHDLSGSLAAFHVLPLYTHPAQSVPADVMRDAERWRTFLATRPSSTHEGIIAAIDAAMLAAKEASA